MEKDSYREAYQKASDFSKTAFIERPYIGSPGAPAQDETNASNVWAHLNGGFLTAFEHTRWWREAKAVRETAVLGDWSWLGKVRIQGADATQFMQYASVVNIADMGVGDIRFTPMVNQGGKVALEGITLCLGPDEYLFTQSAAKNWFDQLAEQNEWSASIDDVTPEYTVFALQGPRSLKVLEAVTGEDFHDLEFSTFRRTSVLDSEVIINRSGVTGELGYEFLLPTNSGKAAELWRKIRKVGADVGLRELGFRALNIPHTEVGIATAIKDYIPARMAPESLPRFAKHWAAIEEVNELDHDLTEHFCSPRELGWSRFVDLGHEFHGREALARESDEGGPAYRWVGLRWNDDDIISLFADQFHGTTSAPPPELPFGQFRLSFRPITYGGKAVGWASGATYSPHVRGMISNARVSKDIDVGAEVSVEWAGLTPESTVDVRAEIVEHPIVEDRRRDDVTAN